MRPERKPPLQLRWKMSGSTAVEKYKTVRVDRPFVCGIYDRELQTFLFLGAIYNV